MHSSPFTPVFHGDTSFCPVKVSYSSRRSRLAATTRLQLSASLRVPVLVKLPHDEMHEQIDIHLDSALREELQKLGVIELRLQ